MESPDGVPKCKKTQEGRPAALHCLGSIYGLKQSSYLLHSRLSAFLQKHGQSWAATFASTSSLLSSRPVPYDEITEDLLPSSFLLPSYTRRRCSGSSSDSGVLRLADAAAR